MRLRNLAALAAVHAALGGCAETTQRGQHIVLAAERPPIEDLCSGGSHCLSQYYKFSSEAFGTEKLAEYYSYLEKQEKYYRSLNQKVCHDHPPPPKIAKLLCPGGIHVEYGERAEDLKNRREAYKEFVAGWLATYPSEKEAYLAIAAAALDRAWKGYCNDIPLRALDAARVGETWGEMADRLGEDAADRALAAGELLSPPDWSREHYARWIEGGVTYGSPARVAPGYENAGESLLTVMSCDEGGER